MEKQSFENGANIMRRSIITEIAKQTESIVGHFEGEEEQQAVRRALGFAINATFRVNAASLYVEDCLENLSKDQLIEMLRGAQENEAGALTAH